MRYSNEELIKWFNKGGTRGQSYSGNLRIEGDKLINYSTTIAIRNNVGVLLNSKRYSRTTSKIQSYIRRYCNVYKEQEGF